MFTPQTEASLVANIGAESGQPWPVTLTAETYRELVLAARQWDAMRSGRVSYTPRLTPVGAGDGNTFAES